MSCDYQLFRLDGLELCKHCNDQDEADDRDGTEDVREHFQAFFALKNCARARKLFFEPAQ